MGLTQLLGPNITKIETIKPFFLYNQDLRSTAIYGAKKYHFQDIATIHSAVA